MVQRMTDAGRSVSKKKGLVLVLYENVPAREQVLGTAEFSLTGPHASRLDHYSFEALSDAANAEAAARRAESAALVVFALTPGGELPPHVKRWIENWIGCRGEREGAIVGLVHHSAVWSEVASLKEIYLRHVALRAGMDYLCCLPAALPETMPDSPDSYRARATQVTSLLDEILRASTRPPAPHL